MKKFCITIGIMVTSVFFLNAFVWEGIARTAPEDQFFETGYAIATNSFPLNTVVEMTNLENGKTIQAIVVSGLGSSGFLAMFSPDAATAIGARNQSPVKIRINQPAAQDVSFPLMRRENSQGQPVSVAAVPIPRPAPVPGTNPATAAVPNPATVSGTNPATAAAPKPATVSDTNPATAAAPKSATVSGTNPATAAAPKSATVSGTNPATTAVPKPATVSDTNPATASVAEGAPATVSGAPMPVPKAAPDPVLIPPNFTGISKPKDAVTPADVQNEVTPDIVTTFPRPEERLPLAAGRPQNPSPLDPSQKYEMALIPAEERPPAQTTPSWILPPEAEIAPLGSLPAVESTPEAIIRSSPQLLPPGNAVSGTGSFDDPAFFSVPVITSLEAGKYYLQLGAFGMIELAEAELSRIGKKYPLVIQSDGHPQTPVYRILLGPVGLGESGALIQHFKSIGYSDAFVRQGM